MKGKKWDAAQTRAAERIKTSHNEDCPDLNISQGEMGQKRNELLERMMMHIPE